jgi:putative DNA primase/helicase
MGEKEDAPICITPSLIASLPCKKCGEVLQEGVCQKCGYRADLQDYGYTLRKLGKNSYALLKSDTNEPLTTFSSLTNEQQKKQLAKVTDAPLSAIEKELAHQAVAEHVVANARRIATKETVKRVVTIGQQSPFDEETASKINPIDFAETLMREHHFCTMRDNETIYIYDSSKGIYTPYGEQLIKEKMAAILRNINRAKYFTDIVFHLKGSTYKDRPEPDPNKLVLKNGILNLENLELEPFTPEQFHTTQLPVVYDPQANCPTILKFHSDVVGETQLNLLQEVLGYCLYQRYLFHIAAMLLGNGKNGKSTLLSLIKEFLGENNVSHQSLQSLCNNRFACAELYGKLANICADIPNTPLVQTGNFKTLTGGDPVSAEKKYRDFFTFTNKAKLLFSCNQVPETKDYTDAFFRRWVILVCNNVFDGEKCDPKILDKLTTESELSGLLNWALIGLKRLLSTGRFSINGDIEEQRREYIRKSNSGKAFVEEHIHYSPDPKHYVSEVEVYQTYIAFCQENGLPTSRKGDLTQNMHQYVPQAKQTVERVAGKNVHVWQYITVEKSATSATTPLPNFRKISIDKKIESKSVEEKDQQPVAVVAEQHSEETRVCGHCANWHKPSCCEEESTCVTPLCQSAATCPNFINREGS